MWISALRKQLIELNDGRAARLGIAEESSGGFGHRCKPILQNAPAVMPGLRIFYSPQESSCSWCIFTSGPALDWQCREFGGVDLSPAGLWRWR